MDGLTSHDGALFLVWRIRQEAESQKEFRAYYGAVKIYVMSRLGLDRREMESFNGSCTLHTFKGQEVESYYPEGLDKFTRSLDSSDCGRSVMDLVELGIKLVKGKLEANEMICLEDVDADFGDRWQQYKREAEANGEEPPRVVFLSL